MGGRWVVGADIGPDIGRQRRPADKSAGNGYEASLRRLCRESIRDFVG